MNRVQPGGPGELSQSRPCDPDLAAGILSLHCLRFNHEGPRTPGGHGARRRPCGWLRFCARKRAARFGGARFSRKFSIPRGRKVLPLFAPRMVARLRAQTRTRGVRVEGARYARRGYLKSAEKRATSHQAPGTRHQAIDHCCGPSGPFGQDRQSGPFGQDGQGRHEKTTPRAGPISQPATAQALTNYRGLPNRCVSLRIVANLCESLRSAATRRSSLQLVAGLPLPAGTCLPAGRGREAGR
jgi:hypothetical protein